MSIDILFSGFGGQGILFISKIIAHAALNSGLNVTWLPSYGPEMRGGTASCSVVISDGKISSPIVSNPKYMVAMNQPSFDKYFDKVFENGFMLFNSDIIKSDFLRENVKYFGIPVQTIARSVSEKVFGNVVMLGSLTKLIKVISIDSILHYLRENSSKKSNFVDSEKAFKLGYDFL